MSLFIWNRMISVSDMWVVAKAGVLQTSTKKKKLALWSTAIWFRESFVKRHLLLNEMQARGKITSQSVFYTRLSKMLFIWRKTITKKYLTLHKTLNYMYFNYISLVSISEICSLLALFNIYYAIVISIIWRMSFSFSSMFISF